VTHEFYRPSLRHFLTLEPEGLNTRVQFLKVLLSVSA